METKFTSLENEERRKETYFTHFLEEDKTVGLSSLNPTHYDNCIHIGFDPFYGDVFKCWDNGQSGFTLYFGEKGDEF